MVEDWERGYCTPSYAELFFNIALGLNDEEALDAIESTFKQFNTFLDLMQEKGYVTLSASPGQLAQW